jgi:1-acyl-sn-glycerol-3-phosphate acyltransferase
MRLRGWTVGPFPDVKKAVIAVGPHTSSDDIIIGMAARSISSMQAAHYLGKKELFDGPFGWFFRMTGGVPIDRSGNKNLVEATAKLFDGKDRFLIALSPEGTRKKVDRMRTGFYYIAKLAGVPIILTAMDFKNKEVRFADPFYPGEDEKTDFKKILAFFAPVEGKNPERGMAHLLEEFNP